MTGSENFTWHRRVAGVIPLCTVIIVALINAWALTDNPLLIHDHPTHLFKAWQFYTEMLSRGRLSGFNHYWAFGYPVNDITPCGGEMWVALFRLVTFARLSWEQTYRLAFAGLIVFTGIASYSFAKRYLGRITGAVAGVVAVLDPGDLFQGGWDWTTNWGVWPSMLACCCTMMAFAKLEDSLSSSGRWDAMSAGLWMTAALWAHQLSLVLLALGFPILVIDHWARGNRRNAPALLRIVSSYAIGFGLAGFFLLSMLARTQLTYDRGALGVPVEHFALKLVELRPFGNNWTLLTALGLFGAIGALLTLRRGAVFLTLACGACLLLATEITFKTFHAERVLPSLVKLESGRMLMVCKFFWFPLVAYGATSLFSMNAKVPVAGGKLGYVIGWLLAGGLMFPFVAPAAKRIYKTYVEKTVETEYSPALRKDYAEFTRWARKQRQTSPDFYRIAFAASNLDSLGDMSPLLTQTPIYLVGGTPAQQFAPFPAGADTELYQALSVKYVLSDVALSNAAYAPERDFGTLKVYRYNDYRKDRFTIIGQGQGELLTFEPDLIRIRISGTGEGTRLKLHVAHYDRWQAVQGQATLPIGIATAYGHEHPVLMEVPVKDGILEFRYVRRAVDWLGLLLTLGTGCVVAFVLVSRRGRFDSSTAVDFVVRHRRRFFYGLLAALTLVGVFALRRSQTRAHLLPANSIFHRAKASNITLDGRACVEQASLAFMCPTSTVEARYVLGSWGSHLCMATDARGLLTVSVNTRLGTALQIFTDTLVGEGSVQVNVDNQELGRVAARRTGADSRTLHFDTRKFATHNDARLKIEMTGAVLRCFDVRIVQ